jgi:hypothetical protein
MNFPNTQVLNFFDNPYDIIHFANSLEYKKDVGIYPGVRSDELAFLAPEFFNSFGKRTLAIFYPSLVDASSNISWTADCRFQKITHEDLVDGTKTWIHMDKPATFTSIIYLSPNMHGNGTGIYLPNSTGDLYYSQEAEQAKSRHFTKNSIEDKEKYLKELEAHNSKFHRAAYFDSVFNSHLIFDGHYPHKAETNIKEGETRLTLITFFYQVTAPYFPLGNMRKIL